MTTMEMPEWPTTETKSAPRNGAAETAEKTASAAKSAAKDMTDAAFSLSEVRSAGDVPLVRRAGPDADARGLCAHEGAAEEATDMLEESFETTRESVREAQLKALDVAKANTDATFDLFRSS